jgi:hypothetical protein
MKKRSIQIVIVGLVFLASVFFSNQKAVAQTTTDPYLSMPETVDAEKERFEQTIRLGEPSHEVLTHNTLINTQLSLLGAITGQTIHDDGQAISNNGAIPALTNLISQMYISKPASTQIFLADLLQSSRIISPALAQGLGFASLDPIMTIWRTFRNISYLLFVIIFLITGFMIMFRHKIKGQTVVTVEQAIPNIIVALLFVTFSYAIGGLLIDAMYLVMYLVIGLFGQSGDMINYSFLQLGFELIKGGDWGGSGNTTIQSIVEAVNLGAVFNWITSVTLSVIFGIAVLFGVFKLFFEVLKSYVSIIISIAFSPIILMIGAIPGQNTFGKWLKTLTANLAVFPVVLLLLIVQKIIQDSAMGEIEMGGFMPPFIIGQGFGGALPAIVGIGILLAIPEIVKKVKEAIGGTEGMFGELAGAAWGRAQSAPGFIVEKQPFSTSQPGTIFKTTGKESLLEKIAIGAREQRAKEVEHRRQAQLHGGRHTIREGGLAGLFAGKKTREEIKKDISAGSESETV